MSPLERGAHTTWKDATRYSEDCMPRLRLAQPLINKPGLEAQGGAGEGNRAGQEEEDRWGLTTFRRDKPGLIKS